MIILKRVLNKFIALLALLIFCINSHFVVSSKDNIDQSKYFSASITSSSFRDQLNDPQKEFYDTVLNMLKQNHVSINDSKHTEIKTYQEKFTDISPYSTALVAFIFDHPEFYWISNFNIYWKSTETSYTISLEAVYYDNVTPDGIINGKSYTYSDFLNAVDTFYNQCIKNVDLNNRYSVLKSFHDKICNTTYYTDSSSDGFIYTAGDIFLSIFDNSKKREAVCAGYSKAFKILCDKANIPCMNVVGTGVTSSSSSSHEWNIVQMEDSKWYMVDTTWDDGKKNNSLTSYNYFLCGTRTKMISNSNLSFSEDHIAGEVKMADSNETYSFKLKWPLANQTRYDNIPFSFQDNVLPIIIIIGVIIILIMIPFALSKVFKKKEDLDEENF